MTQFIPNREIYVRVVCGIVPQAEERLWIATADIKDMYVSTGASTRHITIPMINKTLSDLFL